MTISKKHSKQNVTAGLEKHVTFRALFREQRVNYSSLVWKRLIGLSPYHLYFGG